MIVYYCNPNSTDPGEDHETLEVQITTRRIGHYRICQLRQSSREPEHGGQNTTMMRPIAAITMYYSLV